MKGRSRSKIASAANLPPTLSSGTYQSPGTVTNCTGAVSQADCTAVTLNSNAGVTLLASGQIILGPGFMAQAANASTSLIAMIGAVVPDFTITLTPTSAPATVMVGGSTTFTVAVSPINTFSGAVTLSAPGLPTGAAAIFSPATITGSGASTLTVTAPASGTGNFTVTANGLSGSLTHNAAAVLAVQDYTLTLSPYSSASPPTIPSGGTQTFTIGAAGLNGFTGNIALGLYPYNTNGEPTCNFSNYSLPSSVAAGSAVTMTMEPNSTYCFFQINGAVNGDIHILNGAVYVSSAYNFNFALPASQGTLTATPTTQASTVVFDPILTSVNNFCGTIDFQVSGLPTGATAAAPPVNLCANSPLTVPITITVPPGTPPGTFPLTINASGAENNAGQASNQYIYPYLQVGSGGSSFSLSVSPPQTTAPGGTAQYTVTVNGSGGLGNVILTATGGPPGSVVLFNGSASFSVLVGGSATLTVATPTNEGLGTYPVSLTGMLGTVPKYATALINIAPAAPASIISPTPGTLPSGQNTFTFTWNSGIGAAGYNLVVSSFSISAANCSSHLPAQTASVTLVSGSSTLYVTLSSLTPIGCLAQSYVYFVPPASNNTVIPLGDFSVQPNAPPVTISSPVPSDTITGCSVPAGVTAVIAGSAGSQTVTFAASASAQYGTTNIACSTLGQMTLQAAMDVEEDGSDGINYITATQTGAGTYFLQISGYGFGDQGDGGSFYFGGGEYPQYTSYSVASWSDEEIDVNVVVQDGVCGSYGIQVVPGDDSDDFQQEPLDSSVELCPDVSAPTYTISGQVTLSTTGNGLPGVTINLMYPDGSFAVGQLTDPSGRYSYTVTQTGYYQITPSLPIQTLYWIGNSPALVLVTESVTQNFTATPKATVFLVPGIGNSSFDMQFLAGELAATYTGVDQTKFFVDAGFDYSRCAQGGPSCNVGVAITSPTFCSIANGGQSLAQYIRTWSPPGFPNQVGPPGSIVLIGYSMGGLMARDVIAKNELAGGPSVAGLITLGTPSLGYPFQPADGEVQCPQLIADMAGSWFTGTSNPVPPISPFLGVLATNWPVASYGGYWMAAAGQACHLPSSTGARWGDPAIGCPVSNTNSDCVVCTSSAAYQGTISGQSPPPAPTLWQDTQQLYAHTLTASGWGTLTILGASPAGSYAIYQPVPGSTLLLAITAAINGY